MSKSTERGSEKFWRTEDLEDVYTAVIPASVAAEKCVHLYLFQHLTVYRDPLRFKIGLRQLGPRQQKSGLESLLIRSVSVPVTLNNESV